MNVSKGNKYRRKNQKDSRKRRIPVPKKAPKVHTPKTAYKREKFDINRLDQLKEDYE